MATTINNRTAFESWVQQAISKHALVKLTESSITIREKKPVDPFAIRNVLSNRKKLAFTVVWADDTVTTVHLQPGDEWDDEKALAMCFTKKALGNKGNFNDRFNDALATKMKIIPGGTPKKECACGGEHTCTNCTCGREYGPASGEMLCVDYPAPSDGAVAREDCQEKIEQVGVAAREATNSITELIHELSKQNNTNKKIPITDKRYQVLLRTGLFDDQLIFESDDLAAVRNFVRTNAKQRGHGYYARLWHAPGGMYIDYGSYTTYYFIPGMTIEEWTRK